MKKTMKRHLFITRLASLAVVCGLILAFASCANDDLTQNGKTSTDDKGLTAFSTGEPATRTTMEADGKFYWEAGDKIWVKDDSGNWKQSSNSPTGKTASFKFLMPGKYTAKSSYEVYYPGKNGSQDRVTISANQTQTEPNTTAHFGASGDCGIAKATLNATSHEFEFALDHKAAYLVFKPYTSNDVLKYCYLTKIEVTSDNDITDTYTLDPTAETNTGALTGTGSGNKIELITKGNSSSTYQNGFPLTNTSASLTTNGAYMVIKPGTHTLKIRYWVQDIVTHIEGTITKILSAHTFDKNKYYNMTANLDVRNYSGHNYYMWDAKQNYWAGHEWDSADPWQNPVMGWSGTNYAKSETDPRYYNTSYPGSGIRNPAQTPLFKTLPNVFEMMWYVKGGDPHWDADELWTTMGHLYKGGMWFKKKAYITNFSSTDRPAGTVGYHDIRNYDVSQLPLSASEISKYFYLPALGRYLPFGTGKRPTDKVELQGVGRGGLYWLSEAYPYDGSGSLFLEFGKTYALLGALIGNRKEGYIAQPFE